MGNDTYPILYLKINLNSFPFKVVPSFVCCSTLVCLNFGDSVFVDCHNSVGIYDNRIKHVFMNYIIIMHRKQLCCFFRKTFCISKMNFLL